MLLAASRVTVPSAVGRESVDELLAEDASVGVTDPGVLGGLGRDATAGADGLRAWLAAQQREGRSILGYGAASRAVALLRRAGIDRSLLPAVADASPAKVGLRMPGPIFPSSAHLSSTPSPTRCFCSWRPASEVRAAYPRSKPMWSLRDADALAGWQAAIQVA